MQAQGAAHAKQSQWPRRPYIPAMIRETSPRLLCSHRAVRVPVAMRSKPRAEVAVVRVVSED